MEAASAALEGLERLLPTKKKDKKRKGEGGEKGRGTGEDEEEEDKNDGAAVVELEASDEEEVARELQALTLSDERRAQVASLRTKVLLRRAKANAEQGGWGNLTAAEEGTSHHPSSLPPPLCTLPTSSQMI